MHGEESVAGGESPPGRKRRLRRLSADELRAVRTRRRQPRHLVSPAQGGTQDLGTATLLRRDLLRWGRTYSDVRDASCRPEVLTLLHQAAGTLYSHRVREVDGRRYHIYRWCFPDGSVLRYNQGGDPDPPLDWTAFRC